MDCPLESRNPELLIAHAAGELDLDAARQLEQHLTGCSACQSAFAQQRTVWKALDDWEAPAISLDFDRRLYRRIEDGASLSWFERLMIPFRHMPLRQALPLTATAGLLLMAGLLVQHPRPAAPAPPRDGAIVRANQVERTLDDLELLRQYGAAGSGESAHSDAM
jgi:anti-sigma factor RsiW